ncbi:MAG: glycerol kinase GlpK [Ruminococcaceae bacterium]|nr:glycerol kinase GlpK [Oscillospiraceae bacterium]
MKKYIMALDQGTTSSRCILFDKDGNICSIAQKEFPQIFPKDGWVEHDPMTIWSTQISVATEAVLKIGASWDEIHGIGITNQRETTIVWDRKTGTPVYNAIVWQCRRTADLCAELTSNGYNKLIKEKTGLIIDPYFSASKIKWILDNVEGARDKALKGELCFGTVDSWLIWNLTGGKIHATDYSNASRTMLFNISTLEWDDELLTLFNIPKGILPEIKPSSCLFGHSEPKILGAEIPIGGVVGDQQAALFGQCCFNKGDIKNTYGTGAFMLMNTGDTPYITEDGLLTTIGWGLDGKVNYALEGSVFTCGAAIQWLRDGLRLIESAKDSEYYASKVEDSGGVVVVPAFQGLGAPWWDSYARGMIIGLTRATTKNHIIRATLESIAFQTADVIELMENSTKIRIKGLKVDGGASANNLLMSFQADILDVLIERPSCIETTALGAAYMCGLTLGVYASINEIIATRCNDRKFTPAKNEEWRKARITEWKKAVNRCLGWKE